MKVRPSYLAATLLAFTLVGTCTAVEQQMLIQQQNFGRTSQEWTRDDTVSCAVGCSALSLFTFAGALHGAMVLLMIKDDNARIAVFCGGIMVGGAGLVAGVSLSLLDILMKKKKRYQQLQN